MADVVYRANPRTSTRELLDGMERERASARGRVMAWSAQPRLVREGGPATHAGDATLRAAKALELAHVGAVAEGKRLRELWVDESRVHQLHDMWRRTFFIITYFDDASAVLTYGLREPQTPSSERLLVRPGSPTDIEVHFASHVDAAKRWSTSRHTSPLVVEDAATAARMVRHYYLVVAPRTLVIPMLLHRIIG